jgi:hypothetical protein
MSLLPKVPTHHMSVEQGRYFMELIRQLEVELAKRPPRQEDGAIYVSDENPLHIISPNGTVYEVVVTNAGALQTEAV